MRLELESASSSVSLSDFNSSSTPLDSSLAEANELLHEGIRAAQSGKRAQARASLLRSAELNARNENTWLWLASISEYPEELLIFLNNVLEIDPNNARAIEWTAATKTLLSKTFVQRGVDAMQEGKRDFAAEYFHQSLEYDQQNSLAWLWLASLSDSSQGKIAYLEKVLAIDPENKTALAEFNAARFHILQSQLAEAKAAAVAGKSDQAAEMIEAIIAESPDSEEAWVLRSHLVDGFEEKIRSFRRILEINPENAAAKASLESLTSIMATVAPPAFVDNDQSSDAKEQDTGDEVLVDKNPTQELEMPETLALAAAEIEGPDFDEEVSNESVNDPFETVAEPAVDFSTVSQAVSRDDIEQFDGPETGSPEVASFASETEQELEQMSDTADSSPEVPTDSEESIASEKESNETQEYDYYEVQPNEVAANDVIENSDEPEITATDFTDTNATLLVSDFDVSYEENIPMPETVIDDPDVQLIATGYETTFVRDTAPQKSKTDLAHCPFCNFANDAQAIVCQSCMAMLSLSDLEMLLSNQHADKSVLRQAVERMEKERSSPEFTETELTMLGIGHLNLRNLQYGYSYLNEASQLNPNNIVLSGQVNALLIRLEEIKKQDEAHDAMPRGKTILVVDDSPTVRKLIAGKLEKCGHAVFCSADGVEAMERLQDLAPDLVLLDITMPKMDGYQVCKLIRSNHVTKDVPVVMISGKDGFFDKVRGRMAGTTGYITKPFGPETLMKAVETYLRSEA